MNPSQEAALRREGLLFHDWPDVPHSLANDRRAEILVELEASQARILITLGDQPLRWFTAHFGANPRLSDFGETPETYGQLHPLAINGRDLLHLPLAHPRQIARLGAHSDKWAYLHAAWQNCTPSPPHPLQNFSALPPLLKQLVGFSSKR